ncbi:MAG TPA: MoxR family ATPase [Thermodesulfobacteriota bacterium]|nr:MoxR family ATPase [Thermodesulfobacteriota bacterium]
MIKTIDEFQTAMENARYICDRALATSVYLGYVLGKPLLLEGEAGVGKTEVAKVVAEALQTKLIRLQCYEGLDVEHALYEWDYPKQILEIQLAKVQKEDGYNIDIERTIFSEKFLLKRPLLEAIQNPSETPVVLLIDEIDRSDEAFEAFLLEVLSDFQITIPELGTIKARRRPYVVITSNQTRELHDALKRRCLYHWIDYPSVEKELRIVLTKVPSVQEKLAQQVCGLMKRIREIDLLKKPGVAETLDWAEALVTLNKGIINKETLEETLGCIFKYREDMEKFREVINKEGLFSS